MRTREFDDGFEPYRYADLKSLRRAYKRIWRKAQAAARGGWSATADKHRAELERIAKAMDTYHGIQASIATAYKHVPHSGY